MSDSMRIVLCGCASCPVRDTGSRQKAIAAKPLLGPWLVYEGSPARLLGVPVRELRRPPNNGSATKVTLGCTKDGDANGETDHDF